MTSGNVFNLKNTHAYRCHVFRYYHNLSRLYLRVFKEGRSEPAFYLLFTDVGYFEGPLNWQGAKFMLRPAEDCLRLMVAQGMIDEKLLQEAAVRDHFAQTVHLYVVESPPTQVKIIAGSAARLNDIPAELK